MSNSLNHSTSVFLQGLSNPILYIRYPIICVQITLYSESPIYLCDSDCLFYLIVFTFSYIRLCVKSKVSILILFLPLCFFPYLFSRMYVKFYVYLIPSLLIPSLIISYFGVGCLGCLECHPCISIPLCQCATKYMSMFLFLAWPFTLWPVSTLLVWANWPSSSLPVCTLERVLS